MAENELASPLEQTVVATTYLLDSASDQQIFLSLQIGDDGQFGRSVVTIQEQRTIIEGSQNDIPIGTSEELDGKVLFIDTTVIDMSPNHNHATLLITLKGGVSEVVYPLGKLVNEGEKAPFMAQFIMVAL
jgi:hypothetical protein